MKTLITTIEKQDIKEIGKVKQVPETFTEKIGLALAFGSALPVIPYALRICGTQLPLILNDLSMHAGNYAHIWGPYALAGVIEGKKSRKYSNIVLALTSVYHTLGETFNSQIFSELPQILPGTPDLKDIPIILTTAIGFYLMNRKRVLY